MFKPEEVAEGIYRLETPLAGVGTLFSVYLVADGGGAVIEPGPGAAAPAILQAMKELGMKGLSCIIPTHIHMDHAGGAGRLAQLFPGASVVLHPQGVRHAVDPSRLVEGTKMAFGPDFADIYGAILPVPQQQVKAVSDGETLSLDGRTLRVVYAPGHAPHHLAIYDERTEGLFSGEALGTTRFTPDAPLPSAAPPVFDVDIYLQTVEKLRALRPRLLFYSHGGVGRSPDRLMSAAVDHALEVRDFLLKALKQGQTAEQVRESLAGYFNKRFGVTMDKQDTAMTVAGYMAYFKARAMV